MQTDDLIARLRLAASGIPGHLHGCPDDHQIAAYVDGTAGATERASLEMHLADCAACTQLVGILCKSRDTAASETVPDLLVARARRLGRRAPDRWKHYFPALSAAAIAVVSVSVLVHFLQEPVTGMAPAPVARETRNTAVPETVRVLAPIAGAATAAGELVVRWAPVSGSRYYDVRIVTDAGELVGEKQVSETEWRPAPDIRLVPGAEYYVRIDAYRSDSKAISSSHVPFSVVQRR